MPSRMGRFLLIVLTVVAAAGCGGDSPVVPGEKEPVPGPVLVITYPPYEPNVPAYLPVTRFSWAMAGGPQVEEVRYMARLALDTLGQYNERFDFVGDLNDNPSRYDSLWSDWIPWTAPGDSGTSTIIGDDEDIPFGYRYYFVVQGRGEEETATDTFALDTNVRYYFSARSYGPLLYLAERQLANFTFFGTRYNAEERKLPPGIPLRFRWIGDDDEYYGEIVGYRYGWDVLSLEDWDTPFDPELRSSMTAAFWSGVHTLTVEAKNLEGMIARARIEIEIVPWEMDRDLLLVDDYFALDYPIPNMVSPMESEHDDFWEGVCSRAPGFDAARDVIDTYERYLPISIEEIGMYRNVIWTTSTEDDNRWKKTIEFTPESAIGSSKNETPNLISIFLQKGGHVWTSGRSDQGGGLSAAIRDDLQSFPIDLRCEIAGTSSGCADGSGILSMPYADYCVTVLDKVSGRFRTDAWMPTRSLNHYDVFRSAILDGSDPVTASHAGLPSSLELRDEITAEGSFFCTDSTCSPGGFTYVEVYDPSYWMSSIGVPSRHCFHPVYRMRAASPYSSIDGQAVALWITRFEDVTPDAPGGVPAPSIHFGFPLWYFRHESVDSIADVVFERWGID